MDEPFAVELLPELLGVDCRQQVRPLAALRIGT